MPIVADTELPSFTRLHNDGQEVLTLERAHQQDIRELHVGLLNLMPDAALEATERQFLRLVGSCNRIAQFYVHPFTVAGVPRQGRAAEHVDSYYQNFDDIRREGIDALIITGANPQRSDLTTEPFWEQMVEVMAWARENVCSTFYSCLATHAALHAFHDTSRQKLPQKRWGVYSHRITTTEHPLLHNVNTRFDGPHSHVYDMPRTSFEAAGLTVLVDSEQAGVYLAVSADQFRSVYFQGHPEYDTNSLHKEFKREVNRFISGERDDYPAFPENYYNPQASAMLNDYQNDLLSKLAAGAPAAAIPDAEMASLLDNTWTDTGKALVNNWLGLVYQLTHRDRARPFMQGVDPEDPLGLLNTTN